MRVLFVLSQRPELTGSGITVDALVRESVAAGHQVWVLCGVPVGQPVPEVGGLARARVKTVTFGEGGDLPFPVPGMSDVMPYESTVWSAMDAGELGAYRRVWRERLSAAIRDCQPDLVHSNHLWIVTSLLFEVRGSIPSVAHCHATGLRQMELCPHLRADVIAGLRGHDAFLVLHGEHAKQVSETLGVPAARVHEVGAGYREDLFQVRGAPPAAARQGHLIFVGKYSAAKGLPWLLDACDALWREGAEFVLHVVGEGAGAQADALRERMRRLAPQVVIHGRLDQPALARVMRRCSVLVLPSLYEGLPLVLAEARACGCRLISTALPGVLKRLAPHFSENLEVVDVPRLIGPDQPDERDLPAFTERLKQAVEGSLGRLPQEPDPSELESFTWGEVFRRVERVWRACRT